MVRVRRGGTCLVSSDPLKEDMFVLCLLVLKCYHLVLFERLFSTEVSCENTLYLYYFFFLGFGKTSSPVSNLFEI